MRIISGEMRGFKLRAPKGTDTRPTSDRVKESLFSILGYIESTSKVLDLFAGSGNVGLEFLSRGAEEAYFIDSSAESVSVIKENIKKCRVEDCTYVYKNDVLKSIDILSRKRKKFDYIFLDPPYKRGIAEEVLEKISEADILNEGALVIVEHEDGLEFEEYKGLENIDSRKYGSTGITFFRKYS